MNIQQRVSYEQRQKLLEFMQGHEDIARGRVTGPDASRRKQKILTELSNNLNALGFGATKSPEKWLKCWQDWRCDVKAKALKIKNYSGGTGGGPGPAPLSQLEETLLQFCGIEMAQGVEGVADPLDCGKEEEVPVPHTVPKKQRVSYEQRQKLLEFMQGHDDIARGRVTGPDAPRRKQKVLTKLSNNLNALGFGATKSPEKWLKCWQDWRCDVKAKALKIKKYSGGTGGGPGPAPLSQLEEKLLQFCGIEMVQGVKGVVDPLDCGKEEEEVPVPHTMPKKQRVSYEQRQKLLEFMQGHEDIAWGRVTGPDASRRKQKVLTKLSNNLNALGFGATKSPEKWLKCWQDWRCDVKAKALKIKMYSGGTGGGPGPAPLSQLEETLLQYCGIEMVQGVEGVADPLDCGEEEEEVPVPHTMPKRKKDDQLHATLERQAAAIEKVGAAMVDIATALRKIAAALAKK